jgi:zinc D-Ala-D-Ala carboxypeptidase
MTFLQENNMPEYLTPHFTFEEACHSDKAIQYGIDNTMPSIYTGNAINLARYVLEFIRQHFDQPFSPQSWYRCERLNTLVGGSKTSDHMQGAAADIVVPKVSLMALAEYIRDNLDFDQLILEPTWVHVSYRYGKNRKQVLTNKGNGQYLQGLV